MAHNKPQDEPQTRVASKNISSISNMQINNASGLPPGEEGVLHTSGCNNASLECIAMIGFQAWNLPRSANLQGNLLELES